MHLEEVTIKLQGRPRILLYLCPVAAFLMAERTVRMQRCVAATPKPSIMHMPCLTLKTRLDCNKLSSALLSVAR